MLTSDMDYEARDIYHVDYIVETIQSNATKGSASEPLRKCHAQNKN